MSFVWKWVTKLMLIQLISSCQPEVRNDVAATARISHEWLKRYKASNLNDYIVRRYVSTPSGVLRWE